MLKLDSIADAWQFYLRESKSEFTPEYYEILRAIFYDGFSAALHFWGETHGEVETYNILTNEYFKNKIATLHEEINCASD